MPCSIIKSNEGYAWIKVSGLFTVNDLLTLQALAKESLAKSGSYRALVELDDFQGWSHEEGWNNTSWLPMATHQSMRMALVGDEKWKDDAFMFTGQPMRKEAIDFFTKDRLAEAQAWLERPF